MIPFNVPYLAGMEGAYVADALASRHLAGDGAYTKRATALIEQITDVSTRAL